MWNQNIGKNEYDEKAQNSVNIEILDSILDDDEEKFLQIISQISNDEMNFNQHFKLTSYEMPKIFSSEPTYSMLCSFFGAEKCLNSLISLFPDGIRSKFFNTKDKKGRRPIHFACMSGNLGILRLFYQEEFDLEAKDYDGQKPSHYAAMSSKSDVLKYLWMKGIDVLKQTDRKGITPFHIACKYGNIEVVKFLCETVAKKDELKFDTKRSQYYGSFRIPSPLHFACQNGCVEVVKYILKYKRMAKNQMKTLNELMQRPIDCAIEKGHLECVKLLVNSNKYNLIGYNRRHIPIIDASYYGKIDILSYLLKQDNIIIDAIDSSDKNALSAAVNSNNIDIIKLIIENGIGHKLDRNLINQAFIDAFYERNMEIIKYMDEKLDISYTQVGHQLMMKAISNESESLVNFLLDKGCDFKDINSYDNFTNKWTPFMTFLKEKGFDFSHCKSSYSIPLIIKSIRYGNLSAIKELIDKEIILDGDMISKYDCIYHACKRGKIELFDFLMSYKPEIKNIESCIVCLIVKCVQYKNRKKTNQKLVNDCLKIADILIKECDFDVNNDTIICEAVDKFSIDFLELFDKYHADFDHVLYDYNKMISKEYLPIFHFLENHGCTFKDPCSFISKRTIYTSKGYKKITYITSPIYKNIGQRHSSNYDVNTLLFLLKYATNDELIYSINYNVNIVDVLILFKCFDSLLEVYKKLNHVLYPFNKSIQLKKTIVESGNQELIDILDNYEEEEINEKVN